MYKFDIASSVGAMHMSEGPLQNETRVISYFQLQRFVGAKKSQCLEYICLAYCP
jgi:hypothetical protein